MIDRNGLVVFKCMREMSLSTFLGSFSASMRVKCEKLSSTAKVGSWWMMTIPAASVSLMDR